MHSGGVPSFEGEAWNVGRLRRALTGIPDETPLVLLAEYEPGEAEEYVAVDGSLLSQAVAPRIAPNSDEFTLLCRLRDDEAED
ncbi:DUF6225 family protein [Streptomyces sp. NPDC002659]|uniref:DUF6225 family protein n=1 Tax=Streptomyces sp. NPDC002659 TaxID=3364656 RepID=UPI0036945DF0